MNEEVDRLSTGQWIAWTLLVALIAGLIGAALYNRQREAGRVPVMHMVPDFSFTDHNHQTVTGRGLRGKIWVANFMFTRCSVTCPMTVAAMAKVDEAIGPRDDVKLLSFSLDPETDTPEILNKYAAARELTTERWHFLTGKKEEMHKLTREGFKLPVAEDGPPEEPIIHSTYLVLVDPEGRVRGLHATTPEGLQSISRDITRLSREGRFDYTVLPALNAIINSIVTVLLLIGYFAVKGRAAAPTDLGAGGVAGLAPADLNVARRDLVLHKKCMLSAGVLTVIFLTSYVIYHLEVGSVKFTYPGWPRYLYFTILFTHVILAVVTAVIVPMTFYRALKGQWEHHKRLAKFSFPIWLYVASTGVLVYLMLYIIFASPPAA